MKLYDNKFYITGNITDSLFEGYIKDDDEEYEIPVALLQKLSKDLGFSYDLYLALASLSKETATSLINSMCRKSGYSEVIMLLDMNTQSVVGYTLETRREPLLNDTFMQRASSLLESSPSIDIREIQYTEDSTVATILVQKKDPIIIEEKYENKDPVSIPYDIGVLIINDELGTTSCRIVVYINDMPVYLPASIYSITASRYKRSTSNSAEALEVLLLRVIDDLREDYLHSKIYDLHYRYRANRNVVVSYEEYNNVLNTMRKIPTIIEDRSCLNPLIDMYDEFEKRYVRLSEKKSSYIWRCTALGDITLDNLIRRVQSILSEIDAPPIEYFNIRDIIGSYVSTPRIVEDIAIEIKEE